jgi:hypothetical protein
VELGRQRIDRTRELGVRPQLLSLGREVMVGLCALKLCLAFWPIMTNVDRKIASSDTIRFSLGHGSDSTKSIQHAKTTMWMYTNGMDPANAVIESAMRSWTFAARRAACSMTTG